MSSEWTEYQLDDIADLSGGYAFKSEEYTTSGCFVLRTVNITEDGRITRAGAAFVSPESKKKYERFSLKGLDTLFVMVGSTLGKTGLVKFTDLPALLNQNMWVVRSKRDDVDPLFLHYAFNVLSKPMVGLASGSARGFVKRDDFRRMKVRIPSLFEQKKIAEILGSIDDRITLLRETNATLEAIAQALFKSWFVDFDPVRAKMEGRAPEGMDEATAALFPDSFEETELGAVPRGWPVRPVGELVDTAGGATPDTKNETFWAPATHHWTSPKDLSGLTSPVLLDTERLISSAGLAKISSGLLPVGTLLMSSRAPIGYLAISQVPLAINQGYIAMPPGGRLPPLFMLFWCRHNMENIKGRANGSTFMEISKKAFRPIPAIEPPPSVVQAFVDVAGALFSRLVANEKQAQTMSTLRDTLLPRLISGQLRPTDTETSSVEHF